MPRRLAWLFLAFLPCTGFAQTAYDFSKAQEGFWPDWFEISAPEFNYYNISNGVGRINVESHSPYFYQDNNAHLIWTAVGIRREAKIVLRFTGDNGRVGWIEKRSSGQGSPDDCHGLQHAPRVSDEALILTLYDDGASWIGAFVGDLLPLGIALSPVPSVMPPTPEPYAVLGIAQLIAGETVPRVLGYVLTAPIRMYGRPITLELSVSPDWLVTAKGGTVSKGNSYEVQAQASQPNIRGGVGLVGVTGARPYCIYQYGGEFNRQFEVSRVEVH